MKCGDRIKTTVGAESIPNKILGKKRKSKIIPVGSTGKIIRKGGSVNLCQYGIELDNGDIIHMNEDEIEMLDSPTRKDGLINTKDVQDVPRPKIQKRKTS